VHTVVVQSAVAIVPVAISCHFLVSAANVVGVSAVSFVTVATICIVGVSEAVVCGRCTVSNVADVAAVTVPSVESAAATCVVFSAVGETLLSEAGAESSSGA
jgi:hypothetical protein